MTVDHQSATKFASVLQIYIILPACDTAKIRTAFLILRKKKKTITNIFNRVNRLTNNYPFKYRHGKKKLKLGKQNVKTDEWLGNRCQALKAKH